MRIVYALACGGEEEQRSGLFTARWGREAEARESAYTRFIRGV